VVETGMLVVYIEAPEETAAEVIVEVDLELEIDAEVVLELAAALEDDNFEELEAADEAFAVLEDYIMSIIRYETWEPMRAY
jgi:hypothetical protein